MSESKYNSIERVEIAEILERIKSLEDALIEVDYLISYGQILTARTVIERVIGDNQRLNNQKGILNGKLNI